VENEMTVTVDEQLQVNAPAEDQRPDRPGAPSHDVFVSYSTRDKPVADAVVSRLEQANIRCWIAPRDVMPGMVWAEAIIAALASSRLMVVVLSGAANESPQVIREVERAVASGAVVVPFRIESVEPTGAMAYYLAGEHWLDAMTPPLESHIGQLVRVAQTLLDRPQTEVAVAAEPAPVAVPQPATGSGGRRRMLVPGLVAAGLVVAIGGAAAFFAGLPGDAPGALASPTASAIPSAFASASAAPTIAPSAVASVVPSVAPTVAPTVAPVSGSAGVVTSLFDMEVGDCYTLGEGPLTSVLVVDCQQTHVLEVFALVNHGAGPGAAFPGNDAIAAYANDACMAPFEAYVGRDYQSSSYWIRTITPSAETWANGDREIICNVQMGSDGQATTGSARDSGQ
jgi:hypothetical protein